MYSFREKLHGLEYPAGERLIIKSLAEFKSSGNSSGNGNNSGNGNGVFSFESNIKKNPWN